MSDTTTSEQQSAGDTGWVRVERLLPGFVAGVIVLLLVVAVVMLRLHRLGEFPLGSCRMPGRTGCLLFERCKESAPFSFWDRRWSRGDGHLCDCTDHFVIGTHFAGDSVALRTGQRRHCFRCLLVRAADLRSSGVDEPKADCGTKRGAAEESALWRGLLIGGVGAGLLAVSISQTIIARTAYRHSFLPLILSLCLALLWWAWPKPGRSPSAGHGGEG